MAKPWHKPAQEECKPDVHFAFSHCVAMLNYQCSIINAEFTRVLRHEEKDGERR
jgi:hypothetical protein